VLKVQMSDGQTLTFDLQEQDQLEAWKRLEGDPDRQRSIRAIGVIHGKMWHVLPAPKKFKRIKYQAWLNRRNGHPASLRVRCQADEVDIRMVLYYPNGPSPRMVRTDIKRIGRQVFQSELESGNG